MKAVKEHVKFFMERIEGRDGQVPDRQIAISKEAKDFVKQHIPTNEEFRQIISEGKFTLLLQDPEFLVTFVQLSEISESRIFAKAMQYAIDGMADKRIEDLVKQKIQSYQGRFDNEWANKILAKLIMEVLLGKEHLDFVLEIIKRHDFDFEAVIQIILSVILSHDDILETPMINGQNRIQFMILSLMNVISTYKENTFETMQEVQRSLYHLITTLLTSDKQHCTQLLKTMSECLPRLVENSAPAAYLCGYIFIKIKDQIDKWDNKSSTTTHKLLHIELLTNILKNTDYNSINDKLLRYSIKKGNAAVCQVCRYEEENESITLLHEGRPLVTACKECFGPSELETRIGCLLPITYGHAIEKNRNFQICTIHDKILITYHQKEHKFERNNLAYFEEIKKYYGNMEPKPELLYYSNLVSYLEWICLTGCQIIKIIRVLSHNDLVRVRVKIIEVMAMIITKFKVEKPILSVFEVEDVYIAFMNRFDDVNKTVRIAVLKNLFKITQELKDSELGFVLNHLNDIDRDVRLSTIECLLQNKYRFKNISHQRQMLIFSSVSKLLLEDEEIQKLANSFLFELILNTDQDLDITDKLLKISKGAIDGSEYQRQFIDFLKTLHNQRNEVIEGLIIKLAKYSAKEQCDEINAALKMLWYMTKEDLKIVLRARTDQILTVCVQCLNQYEDGIPIRLQVVFQLVLCCLNHGEEGVSFMITQKSHDKMSLLKVFLDKIYYTVQPSSSWIRSMIQCSILIDIKVLKDYKTIMNKLERAFEEIHNEKGIPQLIDRGLLSLSTILDYFQLFKMHCEGLKEFMEKAFKMAQVLIGQLASKDTNEYWMLAIASFQRIYPIYMVQHKKQIIYNLKQQRFKPEIVIAFYTIFMDQVSDNIVMGEISDIYNQTLGTYLAHENASLRKIAAKSVANLLKYGMTNCGFYGQPLTHSLVWENNEHLIMELADVGGESMRYEFLAGLQSIKNTKFDLRPGMFVKLDHLMKATDQYDMVSSQLSERIMKDHDLFYYVQLLSLKSLHENEIINAIGALMHNFIFDLSEYEQKEQKSDVARRILIRVYAAGYLNTFIEDSKYTTLPIYQTYDKKIPKRKNQLINIEIPTLLDFVNYIQKKQGKITMHFNDITQKEEQKINEYVVAMKIYNSKTKLNANQIQNIISELGLVDTIQSKTKRATRKTQDRRLSVSIDESEQIIVQQEQVQESKLKQTSKQSEVYSRVQSKKPSTAVSRRKSRKHNDSDSDYEESRNAGTKKRTQKRDQ